jgi:hypothetical protein
MKIDATNYSKKDGLISEAKINRLYTIATSYGIKHHQVINILYEDFGYDSSREIPCEEYEEICDKIESIGLANRD